MELITDGEAGHIALAPGPVRIDIHDGAEAESGIARAVSFATDTGP